MNTRKQDDSYTFLKLRAAQLYREGNTKRAIRLLKYVDDEQANRFFQGNLRRAIHAR